MHLLWNSEQDNEGYIVKEVFDMNKKLWFLLIIAVFLVWENPALADFYVISVPTKSLKNVVTVAKGKGQFSDPVAAVNSISDASASNPYLVVIGPGVYTLTQTLAMKEYVDIAGSGENVTKLQGAISTGSLDASSAIISGANNAALSSLTAENTGGSTHSIALFNSGASPIVKDVTATASGGSSINYGVYNYYSFPKIRRSTMDGIGGGLRTYGTSTATLSQSTIIGGAETVSGGTNTCVACDDGSGGELNGTCGSI